MITAVDAHACGEPGRVITGNVLDVPGKTMFEKKVYLETHADHLRGRMLREPRGYPATCCNLILPPANPEADAGFVIMEQVEYPPMSGTNIICVVTVLIETGMVPVCEPVTRLKLDTPAGLIAVEAEVTRGKVKKVTFQNVPAFATHLDTPLEVRGLGTVTVDVDVRQNGRAACQRQTGARPGFRARRNPGHHVHWPPDRRNASGAIRRRRAHALRTSLDYRLCSVRAGPGGSVPGRVHRGRHLVGKLTGGKIAGVTSSGAPARRRGAAAGTGSPPFRPLPPANAASPVTAARPPLPVAHIARARAAVATPYASMRYRRCCARRRCGNAP